MTVIASERTQASLRGVSRGVGHASDLQVVRIVAMVDAMAARGAADDLIAPLRHRLTQLRPARPLQFARLLFSPLDPLIVPAPRWRPADCTVPRTAIAPMANVVDAAMGADLAAIKRAIVNRKADEVDLVAQLGALLWPRAGAILSAAPVPSGWAATGLGDQAYLALAGRIGAVLTAAPALQTLCADTIQGRLAPNQAAIEAMLRKVMGRAPNALPMLVALLLMRLPQSAHVLYDIETGGAGASLKAATDQAADLLLDHLDSGGESMIAAGTLAESGAAAGRIVALLTQLGGDHAPQGRRKQVRGLRDRLDADCKAGFQAGLTGDLLASLQALSDQPDPADVTALENTARSLRALEAAARTISGGGVYDRLLAQAAGAVQANSCGLAWPDKLRLVEILAGSDAAIAMLDRG